MSSDEVIRVEMWKIEQLERLGLPKYDAIVAIERYPTLDWHKVADYVKVGAPPAIAVSLAA